MPRVSRQPPRPTDAQRGRPPPKGEETIRLQFVASLLRAGFTRDQVVEVCTKPPASDEEARKGVVGGLGVSERHAGRLYGEVLRGWTENFEEERRTLKVQQATRLRGYIAKAASQAKWNAVASLERLYADVVGTLAPIKVQVDETQVVRSSLVAMVARMTPEEMKELVAEQRALEQAAKATRQLPPGRTVVEASATH